MTPILTLLFSSPYFRPLTSVLGWTGWAVLLGVIVAVIVRGRHVKAGGGNRWLLLAVLLLLVPLTNLFLGARLPLGSSVPLTESGIPQAPQPPALMFFSALPWLLAGGLLGPVGAALVGALAGLVRGLWDTHNLFAILQPVLLAVLFSLAARQNYRTLFYRLLRQPLVMALGLVPVYAFVFVYSAFFAVAGGAAARLDYALTNLGPATLAAGGELLVAGAFLEIVAMALPRLWTGRQALEPSPAERSLETRFLLGGSAFIAFFLVALLVGDWIIAGDAARSMLRDRLSSTAQDAAQSVPFFLETGQSLSMQLAADPRLLSGSGDSLSSLLGDQMRAMPYFDQLFVLNLDGSLVTAYPASDPANLGLYPQEHTGLGLAGKGVPAQVYTIPAAPGGKSARLSFLAAVVGPDGTTQRILLGRTTLTENPLTQPLIHSLGGTGALGGQGLLLDDQGQVLFSPDAADIMTKYPGQTGASALFYDLPGARGTRDLVYYQPVPGRPWAVVLTVPAETSQQLALDIAAPLALLVLVLAVLVLVFLRLGLRAVTASLQTLAAESGRIARGQLDHPLPGGGEDEVGQLRQAFEQMRLSLQARLQELNQLLLVSQGVASTLDLEAAVQPVLQAVLATGAEAVRLVLLPSGDPSPDGQPMTIALGPRREAYAGLDAQIVDLVRSQGQLAVKELGRSRVLKAAEGSPAPAALVAVPLQHESQHAGVLWAAFDQPHPFSNDYVRFLSTLAGYAALAAANARLFRTAEVGRQRLAAILASSPDPVLVTDQENRLLLANPAARQALGAGEGEGAEAQLVLPEGLGSLLREAESGRRSAEVTFTEGRVYYATATAVLADGRPVGRVCVFQDVTHFKELDALKSEFVSTVSHDLRSPLTLMRGYTTMLSMVGKLNQQQEDYVAKMTTGVDNMARLVDTLLNLGRIEAGIDLQVERVPVQEVVDEVARLLQPQASAKKIDLGIEAGPDLPPFIDGDRALLQQALYNLVENAIKYTPEGRWVKLIAKAYPDTLLFEVRDNGIGIPAADQPRLFEKFFRGSQREARAQRGSGLGLAIVRSIAERHSGKVWVESQTGKGSIFYLLVPTKQAARERGTATAGQPGQAEAREKK